MFRLYNYVTISINLDINEFTFYYKPTIIFLIDYQKYILLYLKNHFYRFNLIHYIQIIKITIKLQK